MRDKSLGRVYADSCRLQDWDELFSVFTRADLPTLPGDSCPLSSRIVANNYRYLMTELADFSSIIIVSSNPVVYKFLLLFNYLFAFTGIHW